MESLIEAPPTPAQTITIDDESNKPHTLFPRFTLPYPLPSSSNLTHNIKALIVQGSLLFVVHTKSLPIHVRCIGAKHKVIA